MTIFCKPFIRAPVNYFDHVDLPQAYAWLVEA
nr:STAS/SEC14 domain-containing protein [Candidatus Thiodictyon syntrophicum]